MNILLLFGGKSCEHDISILTAKITELPLKKVGKVFCVYVDPQNKWWLIEKDLQLNQYKTSYKKMGKRAFVVFGDNILRVFKGARIKEIAKIDVAVPCFHGVNGEDGSISGVLQLAGIPYTCGNPLACGVSMDKVASKAFFKGIGVSVLPFVVFNSIDDYNALKAIKKLGYPLVVKPSTLGSSIGIKLANNLDELRAALNIAFCFDTKVIVEKALTDFYEVNCSAMRVKGIVETGDLERPVAKDKILTFADKYASTGKESSERIFPYEFEGKNKIKEITKRIYETFGFEGVIRVDFLVCSQTKKIFVNEVNSIPGSLAFYLWQNRFTHQEFLREMIEQAIVAKKRTDTLVYAYQSDILQNKSPSKGLKILTNK